MNRITVNQVRAGSVVMLRPGFGAAPPRQVTLTEVHEEIKNGRPGVDYELAPGDSRWAYLDQVDRVITY